MNRRTVNIVNFVRGCEPRKEMDLITPVKNEIALDHQYKLPHTFLLQYDAMLREDFRRLFLEEGKREDCELGVWIETCRQLIEGLGMEWRGRPGYDWDWYVNPGFLEAYTPTQREAIIDEIFRYFREIFGDYPRVVGSWLLDAHSMRYMSEKYDIDAFCICREQFAVDAYTLWGGYYSGGYYPSKNNMLSPAQTKENQIHTPVFRMLGIDPIHGYDEKYKPLPFRGCATLEPGWSYGQTPTVVDWYLDTYFNSPCLSHTELTTGQENSFGWKLIGPGYPLQAERLAALRDAGGITIEPLGATGRSYKQAFDLTPAAALVAERDWTEHGMSSYWYNCKHWRANLLREGDALFFRDIQKFDDRYCERYLNEICAENDALYDNLPLVNFRLWGREGTTSALRIRGKVAATRATEENTTTLRIDVTMTDGTSASLFLSEEGISAVGCTLEYSFGCPHDGTTLTREGNHFHYQHNGFAYTATLEGQVEECPDGTLLLSPDEQGRLFLSLNERN